MTLTTLTALSNLRNIAEFTENTWPYTCDDKMTVVRDARFCQAWRGVQCSPSVIEATVQKAITLFEPGDDDMGLSRLFRVAVYGEEKSEVRKLHAGVVIGLGHIIASLRSYQYHACADRIEVVKEVWQNASSLFGVKKTAPVPEMVRQSRLKAAKERGYTQEGELPGGLTDYVPAVSLKQVIVAPKRAPYDPLAEHLLNSLALRRARVKE